MEKCKCARCGHEDTAGEMWVDARDLDEIICRDCVYELANDTWLPDHLILKKAGELLGRPARRDDIDEDMLVRVAGFICYADYLAKGGEPIDDT